MSLATLVTADGKSHNVLSGALSLPRTGVGEARLETDSDTKLIGQARLLITRDDGGPPSEFNGTIGPSAVFGGRAMLVLVLGNGTLATRVLAPRQYIAAPLQVSVSSLVEDIAGDAGETLAPLSIGALLPRWLRPRGTGADALRAVTADVLRTQAIDLSWRILPNGSLFVGVDANEAAPVKGLIVQGDDGIVQVLDASPAAADILPGQSLESLVLLDCVYYFEGGLRAEFYYQ